VLFVIERLCGMLLRVTLRLSAVSFFNTAPLVYGLAGDASISLRFGVPSSLLDDLIQDCADVALLPVIDYQRAPGLRLIRATGIGCDGETLTVRLFSRTPIEHTRVLAADTDSHTSVVLAQVILKHCFGLAPRVIHLNEAADEPNETRLLIGDKVVTAEPVGFDHQLDLGLAWKRLTGLPFVFAIWTARGGVDVTGLTEKLTAALASGLANVDELVSRHAVPRGWPDDIARRYLTDYLRFTIDDPQIQAIQRFHRMAHEMRLIDRCDQLRFVE
jgi:chorismate dehydratase